jgi:hypothetical protein
MLRAMPNSMFACPEPPKTDDAAAQWLRWAVIQWKYPDGLTMPAKPPLGHEPVQSPPSQDEEVERAGT